MTDACRLYLITPPLRLADLDAFRAALCRRLAAGDVASALVRLAPGAEGDAKRIVAPLAEIAAAADVALLVEHDARLAARAGADGAHVAGAGAELAQALASLQPERIVGAGELRLRDDAMSAGEAGADYVMFGEPRPDGCTPPFEETLARVDWWAEIFQTPCVGYAATLEDAEALAAAARISSRSATRSGAPTPEARARSRAAHRRRGEGARMRADRLFAGAGRSAAPRGDGFADEALGPLHASRAAPHRARRAAAADARRAAARYRLRRLSARLLPHRAARGDEARRR